MGWCCLEPLGLKHGDAQLAEYQNGQGEKNALDYGHDAALPRSAVSMAVSCQGGALVGAELGNTDSDEIVQAAGHFRIYLGAAAGVGKTYAMLSEGHRRRDR